LIVAQTRAEEKANSKIKKGYKTLISSGCIEGADNIEDVKKHDIKRAKRPVELDLIPQSRFSCI
jgi:hypothetical protein